MPMLFYGWLVVPITSPTSLCLHDTLTAPMYDLATWTAIQYCSVLLALVFASQMYSCNMPHGNLALVETHSYFICKLCSSMKGRNQEAPCLHTRTKSFAPMQHIGNFMINEFPRGIQCGKALVKQPLTTQHLSSNHLDS